MVCREIDLAGEIDRIVGVDPRQKVTCGETVAAMVLNARGYVGRGQNMGVGECGLFRDEGERDF